MNSTIFYYIANIRIPTEKAHGHQIMKMCEVLSEAGVELQLIVPDKMNVQLGNVSPFSYYKTKENFVFKKLSFFDPVFLLKFKGNIYIRVQLLLFNIRLFFYLLLNRIDKDTVLYTRDEYLLPILQLFSRKVVWESHALPSKLKYYIKVFKKCHRIVVLTQEIKNNLINLGLDPKKIMVSPDAVDLEIFDIDMDKKTARHRLSLPQDKIILGYTGSLLTKGLDKGVNDVLESLSYLPDNILFVAVGGNIKDITLYKKKFLDKGLGDRVLFVEKVSQSELAIYQKAFDILLMPYPNIKHYAYYMSPLKMFEYMAARRPIITSDLPSIREVLNNKNAFFCLPDTPMDLAAKIKYVIDNSQLIENISHRAWQDVKTYTWRKRAEKIVGFIGSMR